MKTPILIAASMALLAFTGCKSGSNDKEIDPVSIGVAMDMDSLSLAWDTFYLHWYVCRLSLSIHPLRAIAPTIIVRYFLFFWPSVCLYLQEAIAPTITCGLFGFLGSLSLYVCDVWPLVQSIKRLSWWWYVWGSSSSEAHTYTCSYGSKGCTYWYS